MRSLVWLLRSWWSFCGHPRLFPWCSFRQSAVHLLVGFSFCTLVLGGVARVLDLWRAAEDSPAPFSLASSLCATPEQQRLPCPALMKTNRDFYLVSAGIQGALMVLDLRPLWARCLSVSTNQKAFQEAERKSGLSLLWSQGSTNGEIQRSSLVRHLPEVHFRVHSSLICF